PGEEGHPAPVKVAAARTLKLGEWTELLGTTQPPPDRVGRVSTAVEGRVVSVLGGGLAEGSRVERGQVLVRLDDCVPRANRGKLAASADDLEEQKKQAKYATELAQIEVKRLENLLKTTSAGGPLPLVSRIELDKARIALKDALSKEEGAAARQKAVWAELK